MKGRFRVHYLVFIMSDWCAGWPLLGRWGKGTDLAYTKGKNGKGAGHLLLKLPWSKGGRLRVLRVKRTF